MAAALKNNALVMTSPSGEKWAIPVEIIARDRAKNYAHEFEKDVERSLAEDTIPLFNEDDYAIKDWAENNMNWSDVSAHAVKIKDGDAPDMREAWISWEKECASVNFAEVAKPGPDLDRAVRAFRTMHPIAQAMVANIISAAPEKLSSDEAMRAQFNRLTNGEFLADLIDEMERSTIGASEVGAIQ